MAPIFYSYGRVDITSYVTESTKREDIDFAFETIKSAEVWHTNCQGTLSTFLTCLPILVVTKNQNNMKVVGLKTKLQRLTSNLIYPFLICRLCFSKSFSNVHVKNKILIKPS